MKSGNTSPSMREGEKLNKSRNIVQQNNGSNSTCQINYSEQANTLISLDSLAEMKSQHINEHQNMKSYQQANPLMFSPAKLIPSQKQQIQIKELKNSNIIGSSFKDISSPLSQRDYNGKLNQIADSPDIADYQNANSQFSSPKQQQYENVNQRVNCMESLFSEQQPVLENDPLETTNCAIEGPKMLNMEYKMKGRGETKGILTGQNSEIQSQGEIGQPHSLANQRYFKNDSDNKLKSHRSNNFNYIQIYQESEASGCGLNEKILLTQENSNTELGFLNRQIMREYKDHRTVTQSQNITSLLHNKREMARGSPDLISNDDIIQELNLRLANLRDISPKLIENNQTLKIIDLRNNRLTVIPDCICQLQTLWKLRIDYNYLTELPSGMGQMQNLQFLSASQNKLTWIPESLFDLGNTLKVLMLNDNQLKNFSYSVGNLQALISLMLHNNPMSSIPTSLWKLGNLSEFSFDWLSYQNQLKSYSKFQSGDQGRFVIKEFLQFLKCFHMHFKEQHDHLSNVSFIHYVLYFHKVYNFSELQSIYFKGKKRSILHQMALHGHLYLFQDICEQLGDYIDINKIDEDESTPFLVAIKNKRKEFVKYMLSLPQCNINKNSIRYGYPLHLMIKTHEYKLAIKLIKFREKQLDVNCSNEDGNNALHFLFMNFYIKPALAKEIAKQLLMRDLNVNQKNKNNISALHIALIGNQYDAISFALEHNDCNRRAGIKEKRQMFDFNLKGGKFNQTPLYLAVQQNNIKIISLLIQSEEILDFQTIDDEGRSPKDICPYNSPIYKLLVRYEEKMHKQLIAVRNADYSYSYQVQPSSKMEIVHYFLNHKNYESPQRLRQRLIDQANQKKENQEKFVTQSSYQRVKSQPTRKNTSASQSRVQSEQKRVSPRSRKFSQLNDNKPLVNFVEDNASSHENESKGGFMTPSDQRTANYSLVSGLIKSNPQLAPMLNQELVMYNMANSHFKQDPLRGLNQMVCSIVSSDDTSEKIERQFSNIKINGNEDLSEVQSHSLIRKSEKTLAQQYNSNQNKKQSQTTKARDISKRDSRESVQKERLDDEEDDANVPEEENEAELELQKSQMRVFAKCPSSNAFYQNELPPETQEQMKLVRTISQEVERQRERRQQHQSTNQKTYEYNVTIPTQVLLQSNYQPNKIMSSSIVDQMNQQEQGNQVSDVSQIYLINDESINMHIPVDHQIINHTTGAIMNANKYFSQDEPIVNESVNNVISLLQQLFLCLSQGSPVQMDLIDSFVFPDTHVKLLVSIDFAYYFSLNTQLKQVQSFMLESPLEALPQSKQISKNAVNYWLYELINNHQAKLQDQQRYLQKQLMKLENQNLEQKKRIQNMPYQNAPKLKVHLKKHVVQSQLMSGSGIESNYSEQNQFNTPDASHNFDKNRHNLSSGTQQAQSSYYQGKGIRKTTIEVQDKKKTLTQQAQKPLQRELMKPQPPKAMRIEDMSGIKETTLNSTKRQSISKFEQNFEQIFKEENQHVIMPQSQKKEIQAQKDIYQRMYLVQKQSQLAAQSKFLQTVEKQRYHQVSANYSRRETPLSKQNSFRKIKTRKPTATQFTPSKANDEVRIVIRNDEIAFSLASSRNHSKENLKYAKSEHKSFQERQYHSINSKKDDALVQVETNNSNYQILYSEEAQQLRVNPQAQKFSEQQKLELMQRQHDQKMKILQQSSVKFKSMFSFARSPEKQYLPYNSIKSQHTIKSVNKSPTKKIDKYYLNRNSITQGVKSSASSLNHTPKQVMKKGDQREQLRDQTIVNKQLQKSKEDSLPQRKTMTKNLSYQKIKNKDL